MNEKDIAKNLEIVCRCRHVKFKTIKTAIEKGATTVQQVKNKTSACTGCGACAVQILFMIEEFTPETKE